MDFSVEYDRHLGVYIMHIAGEMLVLKGDSMQESWDEACAIADKWEQNP